MSEYPRLVSWSYFDGRGLFSKKNDKESLRKVYITDPRGEKLLETGQVACLTTTGLFSVASDPYFKVVREVGFTSRARKHGDLNLKMIKEYPELKNKLGGIKQNLLDYGEYVYVNLPHLDNYVNPIIKNNEAFFNENFIHKEHFTTEFLMTLITYKPRALFDNGVIKSYTEEAVPKFLIELKRKFPDLYKELLDKSDKVAELDKQITYVGKSAKLSTLKPGKVELRLYFTKKEIFDWDGNELIREGKAYNGELITQRIMPIDDLVVVIKDDETVDEHTEIVD